MRNIQQIFYFTKKNSLEIQKEKIDLKERANIKKKGKLKRTLNKIQERENIIYIGKTSVENTIDIEYTKGETSLQLVSL